MASIRTVDFLPEIFQTPVNKQFLAATLDQVVQNPEFRRVEGFIGNKIATGVTPKDSYVNEPTKTRTDYQLDPCVVSLKPDTNTDEDVMTYPGMIDTIKVQGGITDNANRLFSSDYYTWDPFVDFDKLVNYPQYYWLPEGPPPVVVSATEVPTTDEFYVTRTANGYTFNRVSGNDPVLTLVRGGRYKFIVDQSYREDTVYNVTDNTMVPASAYIINKKSNPTLTLVRGRTYQFNIVCTQNKSPFYIKTKNTSGIKDSYDDGVMRNGAVDGLISFTVPLTAPNTLYYVSADKSNMRGVLDIVDPIPGNGPEFWFQSQPGISGTLPEAHNISSRDVLGVINNGTNSGNIIFEVPLATDQNFYYEDLNDIGPIDLLSKKLGYSDLQGVLVEDFLRDNPDGIDQITNLNYRSIVFLNPEVDVDPWVKWFVEYVVVREKLTISLTPLQQIDSLDKFEILFGDQYSRTSWYRSASDQYTQVPLLTAVSDTLYYQDSTDPNMFGVVELINQDLTTTILVDRDIIGHKNYISPNGIEFTNGLKVHFQGSVEPESYLNNMYYVEGVGTAIELLPVTNFIVPEPCFRKLPISYDDLPYDVGGYDGYFEAPIDPEYIVSSRSSLDRNPWSRSNRWFHIDVILQTNVYNQYTNNIIELDSIVQGRRPILEYKPGLKLFNFGTYGIDPVNVIDFQETDALLYVNGATKYIVDGYELVEGSLVIFAADIDPAVRQTVFKVHMIQLSPPDDGNYDIAPYADTPFADSNPQSLPVIYLEPYYNVEINDSTVCLDGQYPNEYGSRFLPGNYDVSPYDSTPYDSAKTINPDIYHDGVKGVTFYYDGITWIYAQQEKKVNQPILFDVFDQQGVSFGDRLKYTSSNFYGSKLFSYAIGVGLEDPLLGFPLRYLNINNIGDIVFDNDLYTQEFMYVNDRTSITESISNGFVRQYYSRTEFIKEIGWQNAVTSSIDRQELSYVYDGYPTRLDVKINVEREVVPIQVFVNGKFVSSSRYVLSTVFDKTQINWLVEPVIGDKIAVTIISDQISEEGFYRVPINLTNNPLNENSPIFSLGTIRNHYDTIAVTKPGFQGEINGRNNSRDLGNLVPWGLQILQQSSPLTLAGYFMRSPEYDIFAALGYNNREYTQFKNQLLSTVVNNEFGYQDASQILDWCIDSINLGKTNYDSFYWSDMLPSGPNFEETSYEINSLSNGVFSVNHVYDFTSANFQGLLVFLTVTDDLGSSSTVLLEKGLEYVVSSDLPIIEVLVKLNIGDVVTIRQYSNTVGNFVPNTPTKMGLYPKYRPQIYLDNSYLTPTWVIQGHDGSITVAFNDIRDQILLEFEKRIFNNLKTDNNPIPLVIEDVLPGFFRKTQYSSTEINDILSIDFLSWVGWNKLDYKPQDFIDNNAFTYNYSEAGTKLDKFYQVDNIYEETMPGAWRGIYRYFYDTLDPSMTPWEMLGFSEMPCWWCDRYGPAPYTSGNLVLWTDLEEGYVADPNGSYYLIKYARPGLTNVIPVNDEGQLIAPLYSVVGQFNEYAFKKNWKQGDGGPVEAAWWTSSAYPFAVMRLLALTRPAEFFSLFVDRDLYRYDNDIKQYLYNQRYRLGAHGVEVYGDGLSKASYINWIIDYNKQLGRNSTKDLSDHLKFLTVKLGYRLGGYTDKEYLQIYADHAIPNNTNKESTIPPESYSISLYKNQPTSEIVYSALTVEVTENGGYRIGGYDTIKPFFTVFVSQSSGILKTVTSGGISVQVPANYTDKTVNIPYGTVFVNSAIVVDFILSYGLYLESIGLTFESIENGRLMNWNQMAQEFLYFSSQGWAQGTVINLNPAGVRFSVYRPGVVVDTVESITPENMILDQNRVAIPTRDLVIERLENTFRVTSNTGKTVSFVRLKFVSYEDIVVLNNSTVFDDLIYDPTTAAKQNRLIINGWLTTGWDGTLNAPGFILNRKETIQEWVPNKKYTKGQIVLFKNNYWSALDIILPKLKFEYSDWVISDYTRIQLGLLPNSANSSDQLANSYNVYTANLNLDNDLLSYGLIGFRPRQYMTDLNLDGVSQVNLYQQFLGTKGTTRAAEIFTYANLRKESGTYEINEIWGILSSTYGANANKSFVEFRLNEAKITSNPSTIQVIRSGQPSDANQPILVSDIWRSSSVITTPYVFPVTDKQFTETALPSAGYVDLDDVDITIYDINQPYSLMEKMSTVGVGTTVWAAKINSYNWGVYRCASVPGQVTQISNNLNGTSVVQFSSKHGLSVGDIIIIRYVNTSVDGVYRVLTVPNINTITIAFSFSSNGGQTAVYSNGLAFQLETTRVSQPSDIVDLPLSTDIRFNSFVWVDDNGYGLWEVLEKKQPFDYYQTINPIDVETDQLFGYTLNQSYNDQFAFVGIPLSTSGKGRVDFYSLSFNPNNTKEQPYELITTIIPPVFDTRSFGSSITVGKSSLLVIGANRSLNDMGYVVSFENKNNSSYNIQQVLTPPLSEIPSEPYSSTDYSYGDFYNEPGSYNYSDPNRTGQFGTSVAISLDEQWLYVSAPVSTRVFAYARITIPDETISYSGDGQTRSFNYSDYVLIDDSKPDQLLVTIGEQTLLLTYDYVVTNENVILTTPITNKQTLTISRRTMSTFNEKYYYDVGTFSNSGNGATFNVVRNNGDYSVSLTSGGAGYLVGQELTILGSVVGGTTPLNDITITVTETLGDQITQFNYSGIANFNNSEFKLNDSLFSTTNIYSFTVEVNEQILRPFIDYVFNEVSRTLILLNPPTIGTKVLVITGSYWQHVDTLTQNFVDYSRYGQVVCCSTEGSQVLVGAPNDTTNDTITGSVYVFDRTVYHYEVHNPAIREFFIPEYNQGPISVYVNGVPLTNRKYQVNGEFTVIDDNVVISNSVVLQEGDGIDISTSIFNLVQRLTSGNNSNSEFGFSADFCVDNDEIYIGAPLDSSTVELSGSVYRFVNQSRSYGSTTTTIANPILTIGDTVLINGITVTVTDNTVAGLVQQINSLDIPNINASSTSDLLLTGNGTQRVFSVGSIYSSSTAYTTKVLIDGQIVTDYIYDNQSKTITFSTAPEKNSVITVVSGRMIIATKTIGSESTYHSRRDGKNELSVLPGKGSSFDDLGFVTFVLEQTIKSPKPTTAAKFGYSVSINTSTVNLVIGAPDGDVYEVMTFDEETTYFDSHSTIFSDSIFGCGVVFTYDYLPSTNTSVLNPGKFVFGQQIYNNTLKNSDLYGYSVNYAKSSLLVGAPAKKNDQGIRSGEVFAYKNTDNQPSWQVKHIEEPAVDSHGINSVFMYDTIGGTQQYYFDCINPLQGKILGIAAQNIDFIGSVDPANYNVGVVHNNGDSWGSGQVGVTWWDTDTVRFIVPNQNDINYTSRRWAQIFPGSRVDIYQWIGSTVPPIQYTGLGTPLSTTTYTLESKMNGQGYYNILYFFWVRGLDTIATYAGKTLSTNSISQYIADPRSSGIPYVAIMGPSSVAIYNGSGFISASDTILHIDYDQKFNTDCIHTEYNTILTNDPDSFLNDVTYRKFLDSYSGADLSEQLVPDPMLSPGERYGVQFRPRQSMFIDRLTALRNYIDSANTIIKQYPVSESKSLLLLYTQESPPPATDNGTTIWNQRVPDISILEYQDISNKPNGYKYLVDSNSNYNGLWTILELDHTLFGNKFKLVQVQSYYTPTYWQFINWYKVGFNPNTELTMEVPYYNSLQTLGLSDAPVGCIVKVTNNNRGKWELYQRLGDISWDRVGLQDGTIEFSDLLWDYETGGFGYDDTVYDISYYSNEPLIETRNIIRSINEEIFVDEMKIYRNELLISTFEFIYSELQAPYWLMKTSLINVDHKIRALLPFEEYQPDNQTFVLDYINEVKPYHTVIKQFNLIYYGTDDSLTDTTDFDCPTFWDPTQTVPQFISPMLLPYVHADTTITSNNGDTKHDAEIWSIEPWKEWYDYHKLGVQSVDVIDGGFGYSVPPTITAVGNCTTPASLQAIINTHGQLISVQINNPGSGYLLNPTIEISGLGTDARAVAHLGNYNYQNPVTGEDQSSMFTRSMKTMIKYDRYQYNSSIVEWKSYGDYDEGSLVRHRDMVWQAKYAVDTQDFETEDWTRIPASLLSGVDRTMGYYAPTVNQPGLDLPLLIDGVEYPGVQVWGTPYKFNSPTETYDSVSYSYGRVIDLPGSYDYSTPINLEDIYALDAIYASNYTDLYLGTRYVDINVTGDSYISTNANYTPEELVLGAVFDTVDIRVFSRPVYREGEQVSTIPYDNKPYSFGLYDQYLTTPNTQRGHGFAKGQVKSVYSSIVSSINFGGLVIYPTSLVVSNQTTGRDLSETIDYTVNWDTLFVTVINNAVDNDVIVVEVFGPGGGVEIFKEVYVNQNTSEILIDVDISEIYTIGWFVDGSLDSNITYRSAPENQTIVTLGTPLMSTDLGTMVVISPTDDKGQPVDYSWSTPLTQVITATTGVTRYTLDNSMEYTNPVNLIVTVNGLRLKSAAGSLYYSSLAASDFAIPTRIGIDPNLITDNEILVYVDGVLQTLTTDYTIVSDDYGDKYVEFVGQIPLYEQVLISVVADVECYVDGNDLVLNVPTVDGDIISVISWNDPRQQDLVTEVFVGTIMEEVPVAQGYALTKYSPATINDEPGSYDYTYYVQEPRNNIFLSRLISDPSRMWVTVNGKHIFYGSGFTTRNITIEQGYSSTLYDYAVVNDSYGSYDFSYLVTEIVLPYTLTPTDVLMVTEFTDLLNPDASAFRIFQDMRGVQTVHYMTRDTTTVLMRTLSMTDDIIYVKDATHLNVPNLEQDSWGVLTINGERIMYRELDTVNNTVSSLLRGTAGTATDEHLSGSTVYDMSKGTLLPIRYQNYTVANTTKSNLGFVYSAPDIILSSDEGDTLRVHVAGIIKRDGWRLTNYSPVSIEFDQQQPQGVDVTLMVLRANSWDIYTLISK